MIGYVTLGTNDLQRGAAFYDKVCGALGQTRMMEWPGAVAWGTAGGGAGLGLTEPFDKTAATVGNGVMVALECADPAQVRRVYETAMAAGATDEGGPGLRGDGFYAAYFRDPDGNKLNAFVMGPAAAE